MQTEESQLTLFDQGLCFGKTSPVHSAPQKARISKPSSKKQSGSQSRTPPTFHYLQKETGQWQTAGTEMAGPLPTEYSTRSFGESPNDAVESHLSQILEDTPHPKYSLSAKACAGILRRAANRGKQIPPELARVLRKQCSAFKETASTEPTQQDVTEKAGQKM